MLSQVELFCVGFAAVVDTVLLLVVFERVNRPLTAVWLKAALTGTTMWHVGSFLHALLRETGGASAGFVDGLCMMTMASGLMLLTCGILHASLRIHFTGVIASPPFNSRYLLVYLPVLLLLPMSMDILGSGSRDFVQSTSRWHGFFFVWFTVANLLAASLFLKKHYQVKSSSVSLARFLFRFSLGLVAVTIVAHAYMLVALGSRHEPWLRLLTNLSPLVPTLVFAYYIFRRRLLPLVFERTLVYGAIVLAAFYLHRLTLSPLMNRYSRELEFDLVVVEGLLLVALILAYQPLRNRCREGLRYLISGDVATVRDAIRQLSVELSRRADQDVAEISDWFVEKLQKVLRLRYVWLSLSPPDTSLNHVIRLAETESSTAFSRMLNQDNIAERLAGLSISQIECWIDRSRCENAEQLSVLRDLDLIAVFRIQDSSIDGFLLLGAPLSGDRLSDEQLSSLTLLVDQYAATVQNRELQNARKSAERRAMQQEKLSTLGLLAGSLAHELRNPLSSIRTIATLLLEDLGSHSEHGSDVQLIVTEIDRLTQTTQRLLDFSRPPDFNTQEVAPDLVINRLMHILSHLAKQHAVKVSLQLNLDDVLVQATDASLSEIVFNLIKNAIEAVRDTAEPQVTISTCVADSDAQEVVIAVSDNGPGVSAELRTQIFEPFVTGKTDGTGLGLYLVAQRVRELKGRIQCRTADQNTVFEVRLPQAVKQEFRMQASSNPEGLTHPDSIHSSQPETELAGDSRASVIPVPQSGFPPARE